VPLGDLGGYLEMPKNAVATYHTHGGNTPGMNNENFSGQDIYIYIYAAEVIYKGNAYLGTPSGVIKKYNPKTGKTINLPYPKKVKEKYHAIAPKTKYINIFYIFIDFCF